MSLSEIEQLLYREIGLDVTSIGSHAISRAIDTRMSQCEANNIEHYWQLLKTNNSELRELIDEVVIPETWFFRNSEPFKMLAKYVKNEWLPKETNKPLRILSVPCATGEEPYSISIVLIEAGLMPSQFHIDAIDISQRNIELCKEGSYRDYSFRSVDPYIRNRYFRKRDHRYQMDILVKATINFRQASLLDPNIVYTRMPYDVVFCRNLLIYFDRKTQQEAKKMLGKLLKDDGILFVGHAEIGQYINDWFPSNKYPKSFALRKTSETNKTAPRRKYISVEKALSRQRSTPLASPAKHKTHKPITSKLAKQSTTSSDTKLQASLNDAEVFANSGKLIEAESICLQHLQADKQNARAYYLLAMVQLAVGNPQKAVDYLKKVIYLQPSNADALMFLATLTAEQGNPKLAARYRERGQRARQRLETGVVH